MADLDLDELVEVGAKALYELEPLIDQPTDIDGRPMMPAGAIPWSAVDECEPELSSMHRQDARAILSAVLPLALAGARKSLEPFMEVADDYDDLEEDDLQVLVDVDYLAPRLRLKTFRQARSTLSHIDTLIGMADNKGAG